MANESFVLKIVTPRGLERQSDVTAVTLPSARGEIGVLPGHAKYNGLLGVGIMSLTETGGQTIKMVLAGGFCTFADGVMTVLADAVDTAETVDRQSYAKEREALIEQTKSGGEIDPQWTLALEKLARIDAIDRLLSAATH